MPQTGMDWWQVAGVIIAALSLIFAVWQYRRSKRTVETTNTVINGNNNTLTGGKGTTRNTVDGDDNNRLSG